jgi:heme exporter protein C
VETVKTPTWIALGILMAVGTVATFLAPPAPAFQVPDLARLVFFHLPCALTSALFFVAAPYFAFRYLRTEDRRWDLRAEAAMEIAVVTGILTLATGIIFSKVQWGAWWNWDPRQTSYLLVMFISAAYFAVRAAYGDTARRAANAAAYSLSSVLPVLFLIFVYPKLPMVKSLHPNVIAEGGFDSVYRGVFYSMFALVFVACLGLYRFRYRVGLVEMLVDDSDAELANRDHIAAPGVVRPVALSPESRKATK